MEGKYEHALVIYENALSIYDSLPEKNDYLYAGLLNNFAVLYRLMENHEKAADMMMRAESMLEKRSDLADEYAIVKANLKDLLAYMDADGGD
jgi:tetratricopeptide (TPR) repeat protein